ncbi:lysophospholipase [Malassezia cuniculi]|uniref:Acyl-protein thioesterase 1 n=1 Tax=Malassezia cuniculi TaxID=948313 RepID=A0AAF0EV03_9BASI|nr:lysophospholipase [Malassezia cuniculi]
MALKTLVVNPPLGAPTATVFLLHGLGDTAHGWSDVAYMLSRRPALQHVRFVLPTAPVQPVTLNMGMQMTAWFDVQSLNSLETGEDEAGLLQSVRTIQEMIRAEIDGTGPELNGLRIPAERIIVGGFSQGGAIAFLTSFLTPEPLAGTLALSTWLPLAKKIGELRKRTGTWPIMQAHGTIDQIVPYELGRKTSRFVRQDLGFGDKDTFRTYDGMPHSACPQEIRDIAQWLETVIPQTPREQ